MNKIDNIAANCAKIRTEICRILDFTIDLAKTYPVVYSRLMEKNSSCSFSEREKNWQNLRRVRYEEVNLIHDRGTKFGLESGGNTELIMVSLPANASWDFNSGWIRGKHTCFAQKRYRLDKHKSLER